MTLSDTTESYILTPAGALLAFAQKAPDEQAEALQALLSRDAALALTDWAAYAPQVQARLPEFLRNGWIQRLHKPMRGPDARLDDFLQQVVASLSGERRAVLASEAGFCIGRAGVEQDEAELLSAAAAEFAEFAHRQARRGWQGAMTYASFHRDPEFLLPSHSFLPFWVDGVGYTLVVMGEPLVNNPALVELLWGIKLAASRFTALG